MENKNADQPAFPIVKTTHQNGYTNNERWDYGEVYSTGGLTKREYFAAMAMQGMIAGLTKFRIEPGMEEIIINRPNDICEIACTYADVLMVKLNNKSK